MFKIQYERWHLIPIVLLLFQSLAFGRSLPWGLLPFELGRWAWLILTIVLFIWFSRFRQPLDGRTFESLLRRPFLVCWAGLNFVYVAFNYFKFHSFGYEIPYLLLIFLSVSLFLVNQSRPELSLLINLTMLLCSIIYYPLTAERSDMLPVIQKGLDNWAVGRSPYEGFVLNGLPNAMGYLPGILFLHLPAWMLGLDLRWNNFIYRAAWLGFLFYHTKKNNRRDLKAIFHYLALSPYINFRHELYFEGYILLMCLYFCFAQLRFLALPLMVFTRQWSWILSPFLFLSELKPLKPGKWFWKILGYMGGTFLVCALFVALLKPNTSLQFFLEKIFWFKRAYQAGGYGGDYGIGLSWIFYKFEMQRFLPKAQMALLITSFCYVFFKKEQGDIGIWALMTYVVFVLLTGHFWLYFWNSVVVFGFLIQIYENPPSSQKQLSTN